MKRCPVCKIEKPESAFGRAKTKSGLRSICKECGAAKARQRRIEHPEKQKEADRRYAERHPDKVKNTRKKTYRSHAEDRKARSRKWRAENPERNKASNLAWRENNRERFAQVKREWRKENIEHCTEYRRQSYLKNKERENALANEWKKNNPSASNALTVKRQARKLSATPFWADFDKIVEFYERAVRLSNETGVKHHVDHMMPLQSKIVCGLHVHENLQILTKTDNHSKKNKFFPDLAITCIESVIKASKILVARLQSGEYDPCL